MAKKAPALVGTSHYSTTSDPDIPAHLSAVLSRITDLHYEALAQGKRCILMATDKVLERLGLSASQLAYVAVEMKWRGYALIIVGDRRVLISPKHVELRYL